MDVFIENESYDRAIAAIAALEPCPFEGKITADQIKWVLADEAEIYPARIQPWNQALSARNGNRNT
ncbi:MAG: hypothetical protein WBA42_01745 [Mesorhizobium sp.]